MRTFDMSSMSGDDGTPNKNLAVSTVPLGVRDMSRQTGEQEMSLL